MPLVDALQHAALVARQATATTSAAPTTTTTASPTTTTSSSGNGNGNGGSSPLLFFVALGFGVVFTNLWIIVGVKYCFRYNARARQMRLAAEDGEPITMEQVPHMRRRRREKKLMSIDEVNEKFPMLKYKTWVASRAEAGLSTSGGVDAPSRPSSVRSAAGVIAPVVEAGQTQPAKDEPAVMTVKTAADTVASPTTATTTAPTTTAPTAPTTDTHDTTNARHSVVSAEGDAGTSVYNKDMAADERHSDDEDDEHDGAAIPAECVGTSGDTCAICIDTLEDDDDVRGLTCGHAFHAACLDPWLTSRRACCPLCKADYYTPKPRAHLVPAENAETLAQMQATTASGGIPAPPADAHASRTRVNLTRPVAAFGLRGPSRFLMGPRGMRSPHVGAPAAESQSRPVPPASRSNWIGNLRPFWRRQEAQETTPAQLEAGTRQ